MLRRRSEFFLFLDDTRSAKSEKEERPSSPCEDYLRVLLQMKITSDVSEQTGLSQVCSAPSGLKGQLQDPIQTHFCDLCREGVFFKMSWSEKPFQLL